MVRKGGSKGVGAAQNDAGVANRRVVTSMRAHTLLGCYLINICAHACSYVSLLVKLCWDAVRVLRIWCAVLVHNTYRTVYLVVLLYALCC